MCFLPVDRSLIHVNELLVHTESGELGTISRRGDMPATILRRMAQVTDVHGIIEPAEADCKSRETGHCSGH
jgi:hypothetical protein